MCSFRLVSFKEELDLNTEFTKKFLDDNEKCNQLEDIRIKAKIIPDFDVNMKGYL